MQGHGFEILPAPQGLTFFFPFLFLKRLAIHNFSQKPGRRPGQIPAREQFLTFVEGFHRVDVRPVHPCDIPAIYLSLADFLSEPLEELADKSPHPQVFLLFILPTAEPQTQNGERAKNGAADLACAQAATVSADGANQLFIFPAQLFLPDRKNGLASMVALLEHL